MLSVRVPDDQAASLEAFAQFDGVAVAEEVRHAIDLLLQSRRRDPAFRKRVLAMLERSQQLLKELGEAESAEALEIVRERPRVRAARRNR